MLGTPSTTPTSSPPPLPWMYAVGVDELDDVEPPQLPECDDVEIAPAPRRWRYVIPVALAALAGAAIAYVGAGSATSASVVTAAAVVTAPAPIAAPVPAPAPAPVAAPVPVAAPAPVVKPVAKPAPAPVDKAEAPAPIKPSTGDALAMQYQRIGHELATLEDKRGLELCADIRESFRAIKIDDALKTAESRAEAAATLDEIHAKLERRHGIDVSKACLNNPLAKECL